MYRGDGAGLQAWYRGEGMPVGEQTEQLKQQIMARHVELCRRVCAIGTSVRRRGRIGPQLLSAYDSYVRKMLEQSSFSTKAGSCYSPAPHAALLGSVPKH
ncbi:MAG: hypothetical protein CYG59_22205 [Chloroflexi bacterium]|nr:MAG: hypothetical protein CYG59_22205 [Chloroflexota bacterium]